jgi:hypothetical protein
MFIRLSFCLFVEFSETRRKGFKKPAKMRIGALRAPRAFWALTVFSSVIVSLASFLLFHPNPPSPCKCPSCPHTSFNRYSIDEITFISVPRPNLKPEAYNRTKLALSSWLSCSPRSTVLLFVNRTEFDPSGHLPDELDRLFGVGRVIYGGPIKHDFGGVPYIDDWFRQGIRRSPSKYVCFINADIVLSGKWLGRAKQVFRAMEGRGIVVIGQRIDFDLEMARFEKLSFRQESLLGEIDEMVENSKHEDHSPYGVDTFLFQIEQLPFEPERIPPFIMGRYNWDNWIVGYLNRICETVTFNLSPPIYHMNHKRHNFDIEDDRVAVNHHTRKANKDYFGSNSDTIWEVLGDALVHRREHTRIPLE